MVVSTGLLSNARAYPKAVETFSQNSRTHGTSSLSECHITKSQFSLSVSCLSSKAFACLYSSSAIVSLCSSTLTAKIQRRGKFVSSSTSSFSLWKKDLSLTPALKREKYYFFQPQPEESIRKYSVTVTNMSTSGIAKDVEVSEKTTEEVIPGVIVGAGRVGLALAKIGGGKDIIVKRGESVPVGTTGPIYICTRNDALESIVESTSSDRRDDLVFLQNGMIEPWLESKGLSSATQLLVYFAVAKAGEDPIDGITDVNPEGLTAVTGKWANAVAARLHSAGLSCKVLPPDEFRASMLEKLIWISAFMLVGARHPGATCGVVEKEYKEEVVSLIKELIAVSEAEKGVKFSPGIVERLCAYARSVAHYPTAVKEFEWRNGWFYGLSQKAISEGKEDPCPLHTSWLKEVGIVN